MGGGGDCGRLGMGRVRVGSGFWRKCWGDASGGFLTANFFLLS